jgi:hypothetical protein
MKRRLLLAVPGCFLLSLAVFAKSKSLPEIFKIAQYVRVEAYNGDALNPSVIPDDRRAIFDVEQQLKDWQRYAVVYQRDRADLVFLVRKGRIASATGRAGVDVGTQPRQRGQSPQEPTRGDPSLGVGAAAEAGPADDLLEVFIVDPSGHLNGPIWTHTLRDGLEAPALPLFQQLKHAVDTTYPK